MLARWCVQRGQVRWSFAAGALVGVIVVVLLLALQAKAPRRLEERLGTLGALLEVHQKLERAALPLSSHLWAERRMWHHRTHQALPVAGTARTTEA